MSDEVVILDDEQRLQAMELLHAKTIVPLIRKILLHELRIYSEQINSIANAQDTRNRDIERRLEQIENNLRNISTGVQAPITSSYYTPMLPRVSAQIELFK
jgi:hypothetical protein